MERVKAKKSLGQHFLKDENIAQRIAESLAHHHQYRRVLEIGPGMGMLTGYLLQRNEFETWVIEIDRESVDYLDKHFKQLKGRIISEDFLEMDLQAFSEQPFAIIGNFPYNISSQILFKVYENKNLVPEVVGMFQKEVAQRIASPPGNRDYGILSVLLQAFYDIEYLFTVDEHVFSPVPKVKSGVIRLKRNHVESLGCDEALFKKVVKTAFNQRRKTLHNALKSLVVDKVNKIPYADKRAEQLGWQQFVEITKILS